MARIQEMHDIEGASRRQGKVYDADFRTRMKGSGLWAELIKQRFNKACARLGFNRPDAVTAPLQRVELDTSQFRPSLLGGQGDLF
jgi:hypothetical protein